MPLIKRLQKIGGTSHGIVLSQEMIRLLGFDPTADDKKVAISVYGDTLVLRREQATPLNLQQVSQLFGLQPDQAATLPKRIRTNDLPKELRAVVDLLQTSSRTPYEVSKVLRVNKDVAEKLLNRLMLKRYALKEGKRYRLNADFFEASS